MKKQKGFTLIEVLILTAIIVILAVIIFIALDPLARFKINRDNTRWADIGTMLDIAKSNHASNSLSGLTPNNYYTIGTCTTNGDTGCTAQTTQTNCVDLTDLMTSSQFSAVPKDPATGTAEKTDYYIMRSPTGVLTVGACDPEETGAINLSR